MNKQPYSGTYQNTDGRKPHSDRVTSNSSPLDFKMFGLEGIKKRSSIGSTSLIEYPLVMTTIAIESGHL